MTEMEKTLQEIEDDHKLGMISDEEYESRKKQLEDEMAKPPSSEGAASEPPPKEIEEDYAMRMISDEEYASRKKQLLVCSLCGRPGKGKRCIFDGKEMISAGTTQPQPDPSAQPQQPVQSQQPFSPPPAASPAPAALERGMRHYDNKDHDQAIKEYNEAIRLDPNYAFAYATRGEAYYQKFQHDQAASDSRRALTLDPDNVLAKSILQRILRTTNEEAQEVLVHGLKYQENEDYDKAIKEYSEVIRINPGSRAGPLVFAPNNSFAYVRRGECYLMKDQYDQAIRDCTEAISDDSGNASAYALRGDAYRMKGQYDQAVSDSKKALELNPNNELAKSVLQMIPGAYQ